MSRKVEISAVFNSYYLGVNLSLVQHYFCSYSLIKHALIFCNKKTFMVLFSISIIIPIFLILEICLFLLHRRCVFYSLVGERCVTPSVLILELTRVLYKKNCY